MKTLFKVVRIPWVQYLVITLIVVSVTTAGVFKIIRDDKIEKSQKEAEEQLYNSINSEEKDASDLANKAQ